MTLTEAAKGTEMNATTAMGQREEEAQRIAKAEGYAIADHDDDWTFFEIDDEALITSGPAAGRNIHTFFSWVEGRFEGAVTLYPIARS